MAEVKVVRNLLANNAALLAAVPEARIIAGRLPADVQLPAVAVTSVSTLRGPDVEHGASRLRTSRVQCKVVAASYREQKDVLQLVVAALPTVRGTVAGVDVDSIRPVLEGPDLGDEAAGLYIQTYDVSVTWSE